MLKRKMLIEGYENVRDIFANNPFTNDLYPESLLSHTADLIRLKQGSFTLIFGVRGHVTIFKDGEKTLNDDRFIDKEIMDAIKDGSIHKSDDYILDENNWFEVRIYHGDSLLIDYVYENEPNSPANLVFDLTNQLEEFIENELSA